MLYRKEVTLHGVRLVDVSSRSVCPAVCGRQSQLVADSWGHPHLSMRLRLGDFKLHAYVGAVSVLALVMFAQADVQIPGDPRGFWNAVAALVGLGLLAEAFSLRERIGTTTSAVSFVPYLAAILLLGPGWSMLIAGLTELAAETLFRRKPLLKLVHNTAKEVVAVGTAGVLYVIAGGAPSLTEFSPALPAFVVASVVYFLVTNGAVATAVALSSDGEVVERWSGMVGKTLVYDIFSTSFSLLLVFCYIELELFGLLIVIIPLFFLRQVTHVNLQLEQVNRDLLDLMVKAIEARDPYTSGHSVRVARTARALARAVGLHSKEVEQIESAAVLHDVGKIHEAYAPILRKNGKLTAAERELMRSHPVRSAELVATISSLRGYVERCVRHHHECYDGTGYPDGLAGDEIPVGARIIMIADTADAMTTDRPYRKALSYLEVVAELEKYAGRQFDPWLVEAFKKSQSLRRLTDRREQIEVLRESATSETSAQLVAP